MIDRIEQVSSLDIPGLEPYRTLRRPTPLARRELFVAEGGLVVERLLRSSLSTKSALLTPEWLDHLRTVIDARPEPVSLFVADKRLLETIVGFHCHQGIMAIAAMPRPVALDTLLKETPRPHFLAAVDGLTSAENTGVLVRNCAASGVQALLVGETSADPFLRRAVRNSMGAIFRLPIVYTERLTVALRTLRARDVRVLAAHPRPESAPLFDENLAADCCVVFGSEGAGISEKVLSECDRSIAIPMVDGIDSFNVGCASAVVLYEAVRQRKKQ
jgi:tRNA G18 (ribose-2'-O)-methylase SpoU